MNSLSNLEEFLLPFSDGNRQAVVEASRTWSVMHDWLEQVCEGVVLANPLKVKAIAEAKIKTDKIDATILAHLLRADLVPKAHVPGKMTRELRLALRERMFFVRLRTMVKNRVHTIFDRYPEETRKLKAQSDLFGKAGRTQLAELPVSALDRTIIDRELAFIDDLNGYIRAAEDTIKDLTKDNADVKRLQSIPGIGVFLARLIAAEVDDITRFRNAKKLAAYAGLVPSTYSSGGRTVQGRLIKAGNKWLRWGFVEAVWPAIQKDPHLKEEYERLKVRKGVNKAKVAIARKLLNITFHVLKEKRAYRPLNKKERALVKMSRLP